jgi:hypothetical protein
MGLPEEERRSKSLQSILALAQFFPMPLALSPASVGLAEMSQGLPFLRLH